MAPPLEYPSLSSMVTALRKLQIGRERQHKATIPEGGVVTTVKVPRRSTAFPRRVEEYTPHQTAQKETLPTHQ